MSTTESPQRLLQEAMQQHRAGELANAAALYKRALQFTPDDPNALHLYGLVRHQQGAHAEGAQFIRKAVDRVPDQPVLRNNLGDALRMAGATQEAIEQLLTALRLRPGYAGAHLNLCAAYSALHEHDAALQHGREAVRLAPDLAQAHYNLGLALLDAVQLAPALECFRAVLRLDPEHPTAASNLLYVLNLIPGLDPQAIAAEHQRISARLFPARPAVWPAAKPDQALRIGYVSRDFCAHAVNYFFEPVLAQHDRQGFQIYCYSHVEHADAVTARLRQQADHWHDVLDWSEQQLSAQIRADRIDILVDLAGHTENNKLALFASKPAPLQISWLGYPNTTGLTAMDYRVVDAHTAPGREAGTEQMLRLAKLFACFRPPEHAPPVSPLPAALSGRICFASLHRLEKLNPPLIALWAKLLQGTPDAHLLIARTELDPWQQARLQREFSAHGIDPARLVLRQLDGKRSFLEQFDHVDILLDVFPWSGHTIACCALWQGVPVISLEGASHAGRMVSSVLHAVGLAHLAAKDEADYLRIAGDLAADLPALATLRATLRQRLAASPLRDEVAYTRELERLYREAWDRHSAERQARL